MRRNRYDEDDYVPPPKLTDKPLDLKEAEKRMANNTAVKKQDTEFLEHTNQQVKKSYCLEPTMMTTDRFSEQSIMNLWDITETNPSEAMDLWVKNIAIAFKRMETDEEYRKEIAKRLS